MSEVEITEDESGIRFTAQIPPGLSGKRMEETLEEVKQKEDEFWAAMAENAKTNGLCGEEIIAIEWAAVEAGKQSQVAIHKTLRSLLARMANRQFGSRAEVRN
jgi:hypothetical protein